MIYFFLILNIAGPPKAQPFILLFSFTVDSSLVLTAAFIKAGWRSTTPEILSGSQCHHDPHPALEAGLGLVVIDDLFLFDGSFNLDS